MKSTGAYIWAAIALLMAVSSALPPAATAEPTTPSQPQIAPLAEPYEPGSSTVLDDWHFTPGEKSTIANNFRSHHHRSVGHCRNSHHHHSST
ncbi:hypothetical protein BH10CYA1_BH10CYA1_09420 [soil metagenome]